MKKIISTLVFLLCMLMGIPAGRVVHAFGSTSCKPDTGKVIFEPDDGYGFSIAQAEKIAPVKPIVIGQDLDNMTGVDISVEIQSNPGTISYETYSEECESYNSTQKGMNACSPFYDGHHYYYLQGKCTPHTETVYRHINGNSLRVWLVPNSDTIDWLGWSSNELPPGKYPLRFLYPEKWSLGTWTPEGYTIEGNPGLWSDADIDEFITRHPGFNFLKADPRVTELPSYALTQINDPVVGDNNPTRALALFGGFTAWRGSGTISQAGQCLVDRPGTKGKCDISINQPPQDNPMGFRSEEDWKNGSTTADLSAEDITYLALNMFNIPMDLPGQWYIAVEVSVKPATYANGTRTEVFDSSKILQFPGNNYDQTLHSFLSYIWLTTPCNGAEVGACT